MSEQLGNKIEDALRDKKMTQKELADKAGITEAAVSHYIKGSREPRSETLATIAAVLGVTVSFLLGMSVGKSSSEEKNQKFNEIYNSILENKDNFSIDEKMKLINLLTK